MDKNKIERQSVGRPRSEAAKMSILNAAIDLLDECRYLDLTIEAIAARAGVGKATIYRWWAGKEFLLMDAFLMLTEARVQFREDRPIRDNFSQLLLSLAEVFNKPIGRTMISIIDESEADSAIAQTFHSSFLMPRRTSAKRMLERGIAQGEIRTQVNLDVALDMLFGPIYFRLLLYKKKVDVEFLEELVDHVLEGIQP